MNELKYGIKNVSKIDYEGPYTIASTALESFSITIRDIPNTNFECAQELAHQQSALSTEKRTP